MKTTENMLLSVGKGFARVTALAAVILAGIMAPAPARAQTTYVTFQNLLSTNGGWGVSSNGTWVLDQGQLGATNTTGVFNISKARDLTLYSRFDAMGTNAANSNITFQAYVGIGAIAPSTGNSSYNSASNGLPAYTPPAATGPLSSASSMPFTNGYWARDTALDYTNNVNGANSVSNIYTMTGIGGRGFVYWQVVYTGTNVLTNFMFGAACKNNL